MTAPAHRGTLPTPRTLRTTFDPEIVTST